MVRAKIPITWIKSDASRHVTFTKRKKGLKKKVEELAILCGVEVCMICFGPQAGKLSSAPYSWGLPGVAHVINKYRSLSKEEQDKKKLDNSSLLEQQIKKLKSELKLKVEQNRNLERNCAYFLWDDQLNAYGVDDLKQLADMVLDQIEAVHGRISYVSQQQQEVLQGLGSCSFDQHSGTLIPMDGNTAVGGMDGSSSCPLINHELLVPSSQGQYQQLVANLNLYNNPAAGDNPSCSIGGLMNGSTQSYHPGLVNQISLLGLPAFIDDRKANIPPLPLDPPVPSSNFYLNANGMLPSSADATYLLNPKVKEQEHPSEADISSIALHPSSSKAKLSELMEPHILSNMTWRQAASLQPADVHPYVGGYGSSPLSQELDPTPSKHHHAEDQMQWSAAAGENMVDDDDEGAASSGGVVREAFSAHARSLISIDSGQFDMSVFNSTPSSGVSAQLCDAGGEPSMLHLDIGQLTGMNNDQTDDRPAGHHAKVVREEGVLMWNLEEGSKKLNNVYQSQMLDCNEDGASLDKGLVELENTMQGPDRSNEAVKPQAMLDDGEDIAAASDAKQISF